MNDAHASAFANYLVLLGVQSEPAQKIGQILASGLWNYVQDQLLALIASCAKVQSSESGTAGFDTLVARIHSLTERSHATVLYHLWLKLGLKELDAARMARFLARNLSNNNCDALKSLLLEGTMTP
jgi:hypothetical protein